MSNLAQIYEIFSSIQGEGIYAGDRQIFIRFMGCNLDCRFCDTPARLISDKSCKAGEKFINNPLSVEQVLEIIQQLDKPKNLHQAISLTGGEPLLQVDFLRELLPAASRLNLLMYLETNGTLPERLAEVIDLIDIVAMDIKIPAAAGSADYFEAHQKFLNIASQREIFVKSVVTPEVKAAEISRITDLISAADAKIHFVIQPVTPHGAVKHRPSPEQILSLQAVARRKLENVKVIPQLHKIMGMN